MHTTKLWWQSGNPMVWMTSGALSLCLIAVIGLLGLIAAKGLGHFWPQSLTTFVISEAGQAPRLVQGRIHQREVLPRQQLINAGLQLPADSPLFVARYLIQIGNREYVASDFVHLLESAIESQQEPPSLVALERYEWGPFYGELLAVNDPRSGLSISEPEAAWQALQEGLQQSNLARQQSTYIQKKEIGDINYQMEKLRKEVRRRQLVGESDDDLAATRTALQQRYAESEQSLLQLQQESSNASALFRIMDGRQISLPLSQILRAFRPNQMSLRQKLLFYVASLWDFVSTDPREANTEGGVFPAIFGTVMLVFIMSLFVTPFGVIAAVYLNEYATQGWLTRTIRIAVNNLAGVPSIVYGVFGLGFFVYFLGGSIDRLFYPESLPAPTFGTPGILWSSLTLALLTLPVVIVSTEEGLMRIPRHLKEGSFALGATRLETLTRVTLPMAYPAIMTGLILAIARAAGEVAPLMLVGVVKLAPSLPLDSNFPFFHLDRKFMHLGFHIYDVGFQSPNVEAARPLVYATSMLLVCIIVVLNLSAISLRNHLRERYRALDH